MLTFKSYNFKTDLYKFNIKFDLLLNQKKRLDNLRLIK